MAVPSPRPLASLRAERWAPLATGVLLALPVLVARYPPSTDLALLEDSVAVLRRLHDHALFPAGLYAATGPLPGQLFVLVALLLSYVASTAVAVKVTLALAVVALPVSAARLCDHAGASRWAAVVAGSTALGTLFFHGWAGPLVGVALFLASLPFADRLARDPSVRAGVELPAVLAALYVADLVALVAFTVALVVLVSVRAPPRTKATASAVVAVVASALALGAARRWAIEAPVGVGAGSPITFSPVWIKLWTLPVALYGSYDADLARIVFVVAAASVVTAWVRRVRASGGDSTTASWGAFLDSRRFELVAVVVFVGYLASPNGLVGLAGAFGPLHLLPFAFTVGCVAAFRPPTGRARIPAPPFVPAIAAVLPLAVLLVVGPAFDESNRDASDLRALFPYIAPGSTVAVVGLDRDERGFDPHALGARVVAERGGRALVTPAQAWNAPMVPAHDEVWDRAARRIEGSALRLCPREDLRRLRYLLVNAATTQDFWFLSSGLQPEARLVEVAGEWGLFESNVAADAARPARSMPTACEGGTLGDRVDAASALQRREREAQERGGAPR